MLIAQITDTHVTAAGERTCGGTVDTNGRLADALDVLHGLDPAPDFLVISGDLTDTGQPEQYRMLADLLADVRVPVYLGIGNHDHRSTMLAELDVAGLAPDAPSVQYTVDDHAVRLVMADSTSDEHHMGHLDATRAEWLDGALAAQPDRPTVVAVHHPPFTTGIAFLDGEGPGWAAGLVEVLARHDQVVLVMSGHVHRSMQSVVAGRLATVCPSTAQQTTLDLATQPSADALFVLEPAAFQLHDVHDDGAVVTHTVVVGDHEPILPVSAEARARWATAEPRVLLAKNRPLP